jgi:hypothetical protein
MPRFLVEVPHDPEELACARIVDAFLSTGSHFLTHADWGCLDGVHTAWMILDVDNRKEARMILPPGVRDQARIVALNKFSQEQIDDILSRHRR